MLQIQFDFIEMKFSDTQKMQTQKKNRNVRAKLAEKKTTSTRKRGCTGKNTTFKMSSLRSFLLIFKRMLSEKPEVTGGSIFSQVSA